MKAEILKLAEEAGVVYYHPSTHGQLSRFADAVLELAAKECGKHEVDATLPEYKVAAGGIKACAQAIRAMKEGE